MWRANEFPYHLEPGIDHAILWSNVELTKDLIEQQIAKHVPADFEYVWFINTPSLRSVPDIHHAHVMSRKRPATLAATSGSGSESGNTPPTNTSSTAAAAAAAATASSAH